MRIPWLNWTKATVGYWTLREGKQFRWCRWRPITGRLWTPIILVDRL